MENDIGEHASIRGSMAPLPQDGPSALVSTGKRGNVEDSDRRHTPPRRRRRKATSLEVKYEEPEPPSGNLLIDASSPRQPDPDPAVVRMPPPTVESVSALKDRDVSADHHSWDGRDDDASMSDNEDDHAEETYQALYEDETSSEAFNRLLLRLRSVTGSEGLDDALQTIPPHFTDTRDRLLAAQTDDAKLAVLRGHRAYLFVSSINRLRKLRCAPILTTQLTPRLLPQCLADCRVWIDPVKNRRLKYWRKAAALAGA